MRVAREVAFQGFEWNEEVPETLSLSKEGFFADDDNWYMVRRVIVKDDEPEADAAEDLFHGTRPSWHNATQGAGLYTTNTVQAAEQVGYVGMGEKNSRYYVLRVPKEDTLYLDATSPREGAGPRQKLARGVLSAMATLPGMPWPTTKMYDWMYEDHDVVIFKPSAMQRRPAAKVDGEKIPQRFAVLRHPDIAHIVGIR